MHKPYNNGSDKENSLKKSFQEITDVDIKKSPAEWIDGFLCYIQAHGGAAAVWRLPDTDEVHLLADLSGGQAIENFELQALDPGFLIAPFQNTLYKNIYLKADLQLSLKIEVNSFENKELTAEVRADKANHKESFLQFLKSKQGDFHIPSQGKIQSTDKDTYISTVLKGIQAIKQERIFKVVTSKVKVVPNQGNLQIGHAFMKASLRYKNAFVNLTYTPYSGLWLGASPETLIENLEHKHFKTVALAGTQLATERPISETAWTQKEIEEQAYVSRYIINCFKKIRLREYAEIGPKTVQAGNLLHLKTTYKVNTHEVNFPELASVMLDLLHPTSAVCGMPKEASINFLNQQEQHDRAYFSGYLGPLQQDGYTHLFVNLRCCQISKEQVCFYAGAGITEDSNPEKEWIETEMKCQVLADIVFDPAD
ncbi:MAG: isochorismate synthase [Marivirga sp.]